MSILKLLQQGHEAQQAAHKVAEAAKLGTLRGGSAGIVSLDGDWYGKCGRLAHLRQQGVELDIENNRLDMFAAGEANELVVANLLRATLGAARVLHGATGPSLTVTVPGAATPLGARPDIVLCDDVGRHERGLELKLVSSIWTAKGVHFERQPKSDHLVQAGLYSLLLGRLPFTLLYSSRCDWHLSTAPRWLQDKFPPGTYDVEFKDGRPFKILPFNREYELTWSTTGKLTYYTSGLVQSVETMLDEAALWRYYQGVDSIKSTRTLCPRPVARSVDGSKSYSACDYCSLKPVCDTHEKDYSTWMDHVQVAIAQGATK